MFKENELRIGNDYQMKSPEQAVFEPCVKLTKGYMRMALVEEVDLLAIPLTKEWLVKLNCKREYPKGLIIQNAKYWSFKGMMFYESEDRYFINIGQKPPNTMGTPTICFDKVHEFQNIFAFTEK